MLFVDCWILLVFAVTQFVHEGWYCTVYRGESVNNSILGYRITYRSLFLRMGIPFLFAFTVLVFSRMYISINISVHELVFTFSDNLFPREKFSSL